MKTKLHFAWVVADPKAHRPTATTSPFLQVWRRMHRASCGHGEAAHVYKGLYFTSAPAGLYIDFSCLGCGEHYREAA